MPETLDCFLFFGQLDLQCRQRDDLIIMTASSSNAAQTQGTAEAFLVTSLVGIEGPQLQSHLLYPIAVLADLARGSNNEFLEVATRVSFFIETVLPTSTSTSTKADLWF